jgi:hypothetical protein
MPTKDMIIIAKTLKLKPRYNQMGIKTRQMQNQMFQVL